VSDPEGLRASDSAPAGVKPDPTTFEPVTEEVTPNARKREVEKDFGRWFAIYPRKAEQRAAFRLFERVLQKREATVEELVAGAQRYAIEVHGRDPAMVKHPTTWLQRQCWVQDRSARTGPWPAGTRVRSTPEDRLLPPCGGAGRECLHLRGDLA